MESTPYAEGSALLEELRDLLEASGPKALIKTVASILKMSPVDAAARQTSAIGRTVPPYTVLALTKIRTGDDFVAVDWASRRRSGVSGAIFFEMTFRGKTKLYAITKGGAAQPLASAVYTASKELHLAVERDLPSGFVMKHGTPVNVSKSNNRFIMDGDTVNHA